MRRGKGLQLHDGNRMRVRMGMRKYGKCGDGDAWSEKWDGNLKR